MTSGAASTAACTFCCSDAVSEDWYTFFVPSCALAAASTPVTASFRNSFCPTGSGVTSVKDLPLLAELSDALSLAAALQAVASSAVPAARAANWRERRFLRYIGMTFRRLRQGTLCGCAKGPSGEGGAVTDTAGAELRVSYDSRLRRTGRSRGSDAS